MLGLTIRIGSARGWMQGRWGELIVHLGKSSKKSEKETHSKPHGVSASRHARSMRETGCSRGERSEGKEAARCECESVSPCLERRI